MTVQEFLQTNESSIGPNGAAWDSCDALNQLNKTRAAFYDIGDWDGNTAFICVRCYSGRLYLPWNFSRIISAFKCRGTFTIADSEHYAIVDGRCCGSSIKVTDNNQYSPVPMANSWLGQLSVQSMDAEDAGVVVKIAYLTPTGSLINDSITLTNPFEKYLTNFSVTEVKAIEKPSTNGVIQIANCDCTKSFFLYPYSTSVKHRVYCLDGCCCAECELITLRVKKAYFPFSAHHYGHLIDFPDHALSLGMEAISARSQRTTEGINVYQTLFRNAVQFLRKQKETALETVQGPETNVLNNVSLVEAVTYGDC